MLGRLITPLRAAFDLPQRIESTPSTIQNADEDAEGFARDVRIELMRNSIEAFKNAEDLSGKIEVSSAIETLVLNRSILPKGRTHGSCTHTNAWSCLGCSASVALFARHKTPSFRYAGLGQYETQFLIPGVSWHAMLSIPG